MSATLSGWCMTRRATHTLDDGAVVWSLDPAEVDHPGCLYAGCSCPCHTADPVADVTGEAEELSAILTAVPTPTV